MPPKKGGPSRQRVTLKAPTVSPVPAAYPGKVNNAGLEEQQWNACRDILQGVYDEKDADGRSLSDIFRDLPDKEEWADYYEAIPEPESLDNIAKQLGAQTYSTPEDLFKQLHLVFLNAKHYNEEGSGIFDDAKTLEDKIFEDWRAKASQGMLDDPNPYHLGKVSSKPNRKKDRGQSSDIRTSAPPPVEPTTSHTIRITRPIARPKPTPPSNTSALPAISPQHFSHTSEVNLGTTGMVGNEDQRMIDLFEKTLPRWEGPLASLPGPAPGGIEGSGWFGEGGNAGGSSTWAKKIKTVAVAVEGYRDASGFRLSDVLNLLPEETTIPYLSFNTPLSYHSIHSSAISSRYPTLREYDLDMVRLFEKGRRFFPDQSAEYGHVLTLQRLYNALTAINPIALPPSGIPAPSLGLFASLPAGPGNARSMHETNQELKAGAAEEDVGFGVTTFRVGTKERTFTDEARHKGQAYRLGDYIHLINPDDATRPIVGQIFKTFVPTKYPQTHHVTVCWYYRPEQTVHTADRLFFPREVFKTGRFCDHPVEDIIERVSCQFYTKFIRGRPQAGEYFPGWPLYVCNSRYNDKEFLSVKIKNWNSCIPDELRQTNFMTITPFDRMIELNLIKSPFLRGINGPGFFGEPKKAEDGTEDEPTPRREVRDSTRETRQSESETPIKNAPEPPATLAHAQAASVPGPASAITKSLSSAPFDGRPSALPPATAAAFAPPPPRVIPPPPVRVPQTATSTATGTPNYGRTYNAPSPGIPSGSRLPPSGSAGYPTGYRGTGVATPSQVSGQGALARPTTQTQGSYGAAGGSGAVATQQGGWMSGKGVKGFVNVLGGPQAMEQLTTREMLPAETIKLFEKDSRGQILWFSGPPLAAGTTKIPVKPYHTLEYLEYVAKRKRGDEGFVARKGGRRLAPSVVANGSEAEGEREGMDVDVVDTEGGEDKVLNGEGLEGVEHHWWAQGLSRQDVIKNLNAVIETI